MLVTVSLPNREFLSLNLSNVNFVEVFSKFKHCLIVPKEDLHGSFSVNDMKALVIEMCEALEDEEKLSFFRKATVFEPGYTMIGRNDEYLEVRFTALIKLFAYAISINSPVNFA